MDFFWSVGGFVTAFVAIVILNNLWTRFCWGVLGIKPKILDESQVTLTAKECAQAFSKQWQAHMEERGGEPSEDDAQCCYEDMYHYSRWVIERYIKNFLLPRLDVTLKATPNAANSAWPVESSQTPAVQG